MAPLSLLAEQSGSKQFRTAQKTTRQISEEIRDELLRTFLDDDPAFIGLVQRLGCYGDDGRPSPAENKPEEDPSQRHHQQECEPERAEISHSSENTLRLRQQCELLGMLPHKIELAQTVFEEVFNPPMMACNFGEEHNAGIAASIWYCFEPKSKLDIYGVCRSLDVAWARFQMAHDKVGQSFVKLKNRFYKRRLYARARASGRMGDSDIDSRLTKEICGRDVTGELRAEVFALNLLA
ncbi:hypothetical protein PV04_04032 [Phialophora macrospora]|uniref:Uncharacterized protein n=1 Tax=Phialophora macrospora TaxID=1851006 RepID=A0A0D2FJ41_9EURO|nr:hypothetical protein PV04_04032 [Phialophora macrospora]